VVLTMLRAGSSFPRLSSAVILIESEGLHLLVDSGDACDGDAVNEALARQGLGAGDIDVILTTHLHYDHCGNHLRFPRARYVVSRTDFEDVRTFMAAYDADRSLEKTAAADLLRSRYDGINTYYVRSIVREVSRNRAFYDRVLADDRAFDLVQGGAWVTSDVEILPTPGHTRGHLSVVAHGADAEGGATDVLVAGDALSAREVLGKAPALDPPVVADLRAYRRTRRTLLDRYRYIVPGHGPLVDTWASVEA
jgi:glyoxylase-like metal-dependent hydrolase (beta-lactamase superfamily II)